MNYVVSTEKSLKHWLKKKVTITTGTVVGFLIMGTIAFGENILETPKPNENKVIFNKEKDKYYNTGVAYNNGDSVIYVENNGVIKITEHNKLTTGGGYHAIRLQEEGDKPKKELINNGEIIVKNMPKDLTAINGVKLLGNARVENNNLIDVDAYSGYGIFAQPTEKYVSNGKPIIHNKGIIMVKSEYGGSALTVRNYSGSLAKEVVIVNEGILKAGGNNCILVVDLQGENIAFKNFGTVAIDGEKGNYAIYGKNGVNIINNGIIAVPLKTGTFAIHAGQGSKAENLGVIQITNKTVEELKTGNFNVNSLFTGIVEDKGLVVDKNGMSLNEKVDFAGEITTDKINKDSVTVGDNTIIKGGEKSLEAEVLKVIGKVNITNGEKDKVGLSTKTLLFDGNGKLNIIDNSTLEISGSVLSKVKNEIDNNRDAIILNENSKLVLENTVVNGANITGASNSELTTSGNTSFNGIIKNIGKINVADKGNLSLSADSKYEKGTKNNSKAEMIIAGNVNLAVGTEKNSNGEYTQNFFNNSNGLINATGNGTITVDTQNINGKEAVINLGEKNDFVDTLTGKFTGNEVYEAGKITDGKVTLSYKENIYGNGKLDTIHNQAYNVNNLLGSGAERKSNIDKIYSANIYSETVKAAYDNVKINEEAVESLAGKSEVGKWTAEGKALYSKNEYNRAGIVGEYSSEIESTGLMAVYGYGLNETTTAGIAFSGVKQDINTDGGSADTDLFYLGVYGNKVVGNYDLTAGLGYQFGKYDADNKAANIYSSDKYDTQALSGYVQGRYTADLGDGLSVQPKVKLGYTYIDQDNAKDSYFGVSDAEISTFDAEVGFDVVKSVQFEKSQADVKFGLSYTKAMGDTDKKFKGSFKGGAESFDVLGAELTENTIKFNLGAEVTNENGFFYNGGFTYEFGSNDTEVYGVNVGAGYKF